MLNPGWKFPWTQELVKVKTVKPYGWGMYEVYLVIKDTEQEYDIFIKQYCSLYDVENFAPRFAYKLNIPYEFVDESGED